MPERNEFYEAALEVAEELKALRGTGKPAVPFGKERLTRRDHAVRVYGPQGMSREERKAEMERIGVGEMVKLAETYQGVRGPRPPSRAKSEMVMPIPPLPRRK